MKAALVFVAALALAVAEPPAPGGYSAPLNSYAPPTPARSNPGPAYGAPEHQAQTFKNVYVYSAPDEPAERNSNVIRVPGGDKHVNIIFVKTPSQDSSQQTEVILPEQDEHKSLVYVLLKKGENNADVKITRPQPRPQPKPEVNFIRFAQQSQQGYGAPAPQGQAPPQPSNVYGTNF